MIDPEILLTLGTVARALDELEVRWAVGGSFASTVYGEPRATNDVDVVATLTEAEMPALAEKLGADFYADIQTMKDAARAAGSFNLIDERTFIKVDVFVPPRGPMGTGQLDRRRLRTFEGSLSIYVLGPEDTVLQKLRWFRLGGGVSERQWRDIVSTLRINRDLDEEYMTETARSAGLSALLVEARADAARSRPAR